MTSRKVLTPIEHERCRKAYFNFLADGLQNHNNDIWRTILWASHKFMRMDDAQYYLVLAINELSVAEKNQVIHELTMKDEVNQ